MLDPRAETFSADTLEAASPQACPWTCPPGYVGTVTATGDHIDGFGHVNNMIYPIWCMEAAWKHSDGLGLPFSRFAEIGTGFVIAQHEFDYKRAMLEGERAHVATWIATNDRRMRLTRAYEIRLPAAKGALLFSGKTLFISIDMKTGRPCRMPPKFAEAYRPATEN